MAQIKPQYLDDFTIEDVAGFMAEKKFLFSYETKENLLLNLNLVKSNEHIIHYRDKNGLFDFKCNPYECVITYHSLMKSTKIPYKKPFQQLVESKLSQTNQKLVKQYRERCRDYILNKVKDASL